MTTRASTPRNDSRVRETDSLDGSVEDATPEIPATEHASRLLTEADFADRAAAGAILEAALQQGRCARLQFAHAIGVSRQIIDRIVAGERRIGVDKLLRAAKNPRTARAIESFANELARIARESRRASSHDDLLTLVLRATAEGGDVSRVASIALQGLPSRDALMELRREAVEAREADEAIIRAIDARLNTH